MGGGVALAVVLVVMVVIVLALGGVGIIPWLRRESRRTADLSRPRGDTLRYRVPEGVDPVPVIAALHQAGYNAVPDLERGHGSVVVECANGVEEERERVRAVIAGADLNLEGDSGVAATEPVRFEDE